MTIKTICVKMPTCRLINPSKQEIGKISKKILDDINQKLVAPTNVNQWKNKSSVLQWFKNLPNKRDSAFISFDVVEFYPSITLDLLGRALDFASNYVTISAADRHIMKIEKVKKEICRMFANNKLRITIEANKKTVNILDVTLDLTTERFKPYSKPLSMCTVSQTTHLT